MSRKVMIVVEDNGKTVGPDSSFNVYLAGDKERIGKIKVEDMTAAEFWGAKLFEICCGVLQQSGAIRTVDGAPIDKGGH